MTNIITFYTHSNTLHLLMNAVVHVKGFRSGLVSRGKGGWTAEIPWNGGWIPYFWWMDSMEWWMDSMVFPHGFHTFSILFPDGFHGISRWIPYGMSSWNHNFTLIHKFKPKYWVV